MDSNTDEALKIWKALKPMIDAEIDLKTRSCIRAKKMNVVTAPRDVGQPLVGVKEAYGNEIFIPYNIQIQQVLAGYPVWVWYYSDDASTMIAMAMGDGQITIPQVNSPGDAQ